MVLSLEWLVFSVNLTRTVRIVTCLWTWKRVTEICVNIDMLSYYIVSEGHSSCYEDSSFIMCWGFEYHVVFSRTRVECNHMQIWKSLPNHCIQQCAIVSFDYSHSWYYLRREISYFTRVFIFSDFGMVWMPDMLMQNESNDLMMEPVTDSPFFVDASGQTLSDDEIRCRSQMVSFYENVWTRNDFSSSHPLILLLGYGRIHDVRRFGRVYEMVRE